MVSNKSEVKEKDKPIYVLDKKTLDILPLCVVWCDVVACVHNQVPLCHQHQSPLTGIFYPATELQLLVPIFPAG